MRSASRAHFVHASAIMRSVALFCPPVCSANRLHSSAYSRNLAGFCIPYPYDNSWSACQRASGTKVPLSICWFSGNKTGRDDFVRALIRSFPVRAKLANVSRPKVCNASVNSVRVLGASRLLLVGRTAFECSRHSSGCCLSSDRRKGGCGSQTTAANRGLSYSRRASDLARRVDGLSQEQCARSVPAICCFHAQQ